MRSPNVRAALGTIALFVAASCSDQLIAPATSVRPAAAARTEGTDPRPSFLHDNNEKYADNGSHPSTGHAGSASIMSRALLGRDGSTLVESTTGVLDAGTPPGTIAKVQARLVHYADTSTSNYNDLSAGGYWSHTYASLARHDLLLLHSNVRGIDATRTDVVFTRDTVKLRPDLTASDLVAPARAYVNTAVHIAAAIAEINRDVGARATCVLNVDGSQVDQAQAIWVDAGDAVTCAFRHTFPSAGTKVISVSVANVVPGDWDSANNSVTGSIDIVTPEVRLTWSMSFVGGDLTYTYFYNTSLVQGYATATEHMRSLHVDGWSADPAPFGTNMNFSGSQTSDGIVVGTAAAIAHPYPDGVVTCFYGYDSPRTTYFWACQYPGYTSVQATTFSTHGVYYGSFYYPYPGSYYSYTYGIDVGFGTYSIGSNAGFNVTLTDATGMSWTARASTPLYATPNSYSYGTIWGHYTQVGTRYFGSNAGN